MNTVSRWRVVPTSRLSSALLLFLGVLVMAYNIWQLTRADDVAILPVLAVALGVVVIVLALVGLVVNRRQPR